MQKTRLDVIGDPIEHSKSPIIHETVLSELGVDFEYRKVNVKKGGLKEYIDEVKRLGICGFNVTMPHKKDIMSFLDYTDTEALLFDSVNTVEVKDGKLIGYNTDGRGFVQAIYDLGFEICGKNVVVLGAGGVASTIALKCEIEDAKKITVLNRTLSSAQANADELDECEALAKALTTENITDSMPDCDILVNATPLGMSGIENNFEDFSFFDSLKDGALVYDLIYNPEETALLKEAKMRGFKTLNGLNMLIYQGIWADKVFLKKDLDFLYLKRKIESKLKNF